jgi:hypothetical protein
MLGDPTSRPEQTCLHPIVPLIVPGPLVPAVAIARSSNWGGSTLSVNYFEKAGSGLGSPISGAAVRGRGAQHIDRVIHRGGNGGVIERRAELFRIAWIGVHQDDEEATRAHCDSGDSGTAVDNGRLHLLNEAGRERESNPPRTGSRPLPDLKSGRPTGDESGPESGVRFPIGHATPPPIRLCFVPKSSVVQTTFVPSRKPESRLPLGGTSSLSD